MHAFVMVVFLLLLVLGPLFVFAGQLSRTKLAGLREYGTLAQRYVREATSPTSGSPMPSTAGSSTSFGSENIRSSAHEETRGGTPGGSTGPGGSRRS